MKKNITLILSLILAFSLSAKEQTLLSTMESGGEGGFGYKLAQLKGQYVAFVGGQGGWIIGHTLQIGGGGYGLVTPELVEKSNKDAYTLKMGYGGPFIRYIANSDDLIHFTLSCLGGYGGAYYSKASDVEEPDDKNVVTLFVAEPELEIILNVTSFFRLGIGASYRYVSGSDVTSPEGMTITAADLSGPSAGIHFHWGGF